MTINFGKRKKLAIGIPTYKRPDFAIRLIKEIISLEMYDQIIVSSNSYENELINYINSINSSKIIFNQQSENVGMAKNYFDIIKLCDCEYLHMISDEDSIYHENLRDLYKEISENPPSRSAKLRYVIKKTDFYNFDTDIEDQFKNLIEIENYGDKL